MLAGVSVRHNDQVDGFYLKAQRISRREQQENSLVQVRCRQGIVDEHGQTAKEKGKASCSVGRRSTGEPTR